MCGIAGYIGKRKASPILLEGLRRLEYRGYDSVGMAILSNNKIEIKKDIGRVEEVNKKLNFEEMEGNIGISHTRWSTHGKVTLENAHPHTGCNDDITIVHNGIIENYLELKEHFNDHKFKSFTDSEVIAHLIEENYKGNLFEAVLKTLKLVSGAYAVCVMHKNHDEIIVARNGSPICIGIGEGENFIASDVSAFIGETKKVTYLDDLQVARVAKDDVTVFDTKGKPVVKCISTVDWDLEQSQKQGYKHFMLKEIHEQPEVVTNSLPIPIEYETKAKKIFLVACGTAGYACLVGKYLIENMARIPCEFVVASEFRYKDPIIGKDDLLIVVSQSGETADTLAALRLAKERGAKTLGLINVVDSTIARECDDVIYTRAGPEIGVASTKAFISQLIVLYKLAAKIAGKKVDLEKIPKLMEKILEQKKHIQKIAKKYFRVYNFIYIGRNLNFPIALEGALKLKEISYIHAEGYAAGEMKHGPIALVTDEVPTVAIAVKDSVYPKVISNIQEVRARNGKVIAIGTEGDEDIKQHADDVINVSKVDELHYPLLTVIPLQMLAYYIADLRHCDIDKPRNLAKSVTVE